MSLVAYRRTDKKTEDACFLFREENNSMIKLDKIEDEKDYKKMANVIQNYVLHGFSGEGEAPHLTLDPDQVRELWWISLRIQEA